MATIAIDFDGTMVKHRWPEIGESIGAEEVLLDLLKKGHKLILLTMRDGDKLKDAINWFKERGIELHGINSNPSQKWSKSPKIYASLFIDDAALGCPLIRAAHDRAYVDWVKVKELLKETGYL